jgi:hypothetical protein
MYHSEYLLVVFRLWIIDGCFLQKAVKEHKLEELINQAREENPLRELDAHLDRTHSS